MKQINEGDTLSFSAGRYGDTQTTLPFVACTSFVLEAAIYGRFPQGSGYSQYGVVRYLVDCGLIRPLPVTNVDLGAWGDLDVKVKQHLDIER